MIRIAQKYIDQLKERLLASGVQLTVEETVSSYFASRCKPKDGARHLRRMVQEEVEGPLAEYLLSAQKKIAKLHCVMEGGSVVFQNI